MNDIGRMAYLILSRDDASVRAYGQRPYVNINFTPMIIENYGQGLPLTSMLPSRYVQRRSVTLSCALRRSSRIGTFPIYESVRSVAMTNAIIASSLRVTQIICYIFAVICRAITISVRRTSIAEGFTSNTIRLELVKDIISFFLELRRD